MNIRMMIPKNRLISGTTARRIGFTAVGCRHDAILRPLILAAFSTWREPQKLAPATLLGKVMGLFHSHLKKLEEE
jgi:hypothetical protein